MFSVADAVVAKRKGQHRNQCEAWTFPKSPDCVPDALRQAVHQELRVRVF